MRFACIHSKHLSEAVWSDFGSSVAVRDSCWCAWSHCPDPMTLKRTCWRMGSANFVNNRYYSGMMDSKLFENGFIMGLLRSSFTCHVAPSKFFSFKLILKLFWSYSLNLSCSLLCSYLVFVSFHLILSVKQISCKWSTGYCSLLFFHNRPQVADQKHLLLKEHC